MLETANLANPWNYSKWKTSLIKPKAVIDNGLFLFPFLSSLIHSLDIIIEYLCHMVFPHHRVSPTGFTIEGFSPSDLVIGFDKPR